MAAKVYDDQGSQTKNPAEYDPNRVPGAEELERRTDMDGSKVLEREENRSKKDSGEPEPSAGDDEKQALDDKLGEAQSPAKRADQSDDKAGGFYKADDGDGGGFFASFKKRKRGAAVAGVSLIVVIAGIGSFGGFFNVFKLNNMISNIDAKTFARLHGVEKRRSYAWMKSYMEVRLMDYGENADMTPGREQNAFFKSGRVQTGSPFADWYRTMRQSKFEDKMFKNSGVKFTSILTPGGQLKTGRIDVSRATALKSPTLAQTYNISPADYAAIQKGDLKAIQKYQHLFDVTIYDTDSQLRTALRKEVEDNTRSWQVFQRRHIRQAEQNTIGARSWRFFEKTRDKADQKKFDMRTKIILKAIPETTKAGSLIRCMLANTCQGDGDPGNRGTNGVDENRVTPSGQSEKELAQKILTRLGLFSSVINISQTLDTISNIDKLVGSGALVSYIALARGQQALGLYQTLITARDQSQTGELTGPEFNSFMQVFSTATGSEAQTKVINSKGDPSVLNQSPEAKKYCSDDHQEWMRLPQNQAAAAKEFAYLCPDHMIGGPSRAADITQGYNENLKPVIHPFAQKWDSIRNSPLGTILDIINKVIGWFADIATSLVLKIADILGLGRDIHRIMEWMGNFALGFLGGGPMLTGGEPPGIFMNVMTQGAAFGAESSSRQMGAALSNPATVASNDAVMADYYQQNNQEMGVFQKYFSLSNPDSIGSHSTLAISNIGSSSFSNILSGISNGFFGVFSNFSAKAKAAGDDSRRGAEFAGIEQYDFPAACTDTDPMNITKPSDASNIGAVLGPKAAAALDKAGWEVATDSAQYFDFLYGQSSDAKLIKKVYNCNLLDNSIRGSTGFLFGFKNDHGLEDGGNPAAATTTPTSTPTNPSGGGNPIVSINGYTWPVDLSKAEVSSGYPWPCPGNCHHDNTPAFDLSNKAAVADSSGAHDNTAVGRAEFAITNGTINNLHIYNGIAGCYSFHIVSSLDGYDYYYTHSRNPVVHNGQVVKTGDKVAEIGERRCTGNGSYPHLHIDRGSPQGAGGGQVCCRDPGLVPIINSLYAQLP